MTRALGILLAVAGLVAAPSGEAVATTVLGGAGQAQVRITSQGTTIACSAPLALHLTADAAGFLLTQNVGHGTGAPACTFEAAVQGTAVASNLIPSAHRCFVGNGAGGVGVSLSPYQLRVSGNTYTATRDDWLACSPQERVLDDITVVASSGSLTYARRLTLGPLGMPRFTLEVSAALSRLPS